jgi:hypothetical protein
MREREDASAIDICFDPCAILLSGYFFPFVSEWECVSNVTQTPLHYATWGGHVECVEILLRGNANVNAQDVRNLLFEGVHCGERREAERRKEYLWRYYLE